MDIRAVLFDFGGVLAEEGFQEGLYAIAEKFGHDKKSFFELANEAVYSSGYVTGTGMEMDYWSVVRQRSGINATDEELRQEILSRFILRDWMLETVDTLRAKDIFTGILSDQTDWLDLLDSRYGFFQHFDAVFNSFHLGRTKKDPATFPKTLETLGLQAEKVLFVDDNVGHIERAEAAGMLTHHYTGRDGFLMKLQELGLA